MSTRTLFPSTGIRARARIAVSLAAVITSVAAAPAAAQHAASADAAELVEMYYADSHTILKAVYGLSEDQWNFKSSPDRWSIAEVLEHIVLADTWGLETMKKEGADREMSADAVAAAEEQEAGLVATLKDRSQKFEAPPPFQPTGSFGGPKALVAAFEKDRAAIGSYLEAVDFDMRARYATHPILGEMDMHGWAVFLLEHGNRHLQQIEEVKAAYGYPTN